MTPRPIPASVRALLPLCGAPNDHEALGACRGIGRKLQAAGLDWHALAAAIPVGEGQDNVTSLSHRPRPFNDFAWKRAFTPRQEQQHRARVRFCQDRAWRLTEWERGFLNNVARLHGNLSIKQADRLAEMTDRLDMEVRRAC
ncbi:hypothetical protein [Methylobacterium sp. E-046]|uniref:hypothetical protein n=1 Tax=Methylobacterium sp. E-046 TaxID=2836576 RepID=UPI001FB9143B|nr:hypothetical protein [Methylobacterium sp. E-046]MCJ2098446.1 hypothetical protein [Methylobacterium sp. E-046]